MKPTLNNNHSSGIKCFLVLFIMLLSMNSTILANNSKPLRWFYNPERTDNLTTSTQKGAAEAKSLGYRYVGLEGHILIKPQAKTRTLKLFFNPATKDNYLTATLKGELEAKAAGYKFVRSEGYVYSSPGKGRKAMKSYFNASRNDYFTTASSTGKNNAGNGRYRFKRIEGYVLSKPIPQTTSGNDRGPIVSTDNNKPKRPSFENVPIWRLQLYVVTSHRNNAGTDGVVSISLSGVGINRFYLDKGGNDRERGDKDYYDIMPTGIKTIKDIKVLSLYILGRDGWNIAEIGLIVNEAPVPIFKKFYKNGIWLDNGSGKKSRLNISYEELRKHPNWKHTSRNKSITSVPKKINIHKLEKMMECYIGHRMNANGKRDKWEFGKKSGRAYVEGKYNQSNRLKFDLDLVRHLPDVYPGVKHIEREMDVDFYLLFEQKKGKITVEPRGLVGSNGHRLNTQGNYLMAFSKKLAYRLNKMIGLGNYKGLALSNQGNIEFY